MQHRGKNIGCIPSLDCEANSLGEEANSFIPVGHDQPPTRRRSWTG